MKLETSLKNQKTALRQNLRARRRNLAAAEKQAMDDAIHGFLAAFVSESQAQTVAAFWPFDGEPDLLPTLALFDREGIMVALPVIQQSPGRPNMIFRQWSSSTRMENSQYGIPEPVGTPEIFLHVVDLVLLPLVGWDDSGGRLGMGAGYYDRALQPFRQSPAPLRVGVAYGQQKVSQLPSEPWDIPLHGVLSETGWLDLS